MNFIQKEVILLNDNLQGEDMIEGIHQMETLTTVIGERVIITPVVAEIRLIEIHPIITDLLTLMEEEVEVGVLAEEVEETIP